MKIISELLEGGFHSFEWKERKEKIADYRRVWKEVQPSVFKKEPAFLKVCYFFILPINEKTEIFEGIIKPCYWIDPWEEKNYIILGQDGKEYYDTETCIVGKNKKETQRILDELKESLTD